MNDTGSAAAQRPSRAAWSVRLLTATVALAALTVWVALPEHPAEGGVQLPWWALALAFFAAESAPIRLQFRRESQSFTLTEIPLVLGLFFLPPEQLLTVRAGVGLVVYGFVRRQSPIKVAFNVSAMLLETQLSLLVIGVVASRDGVVSGIDAIGAVVAMLAGAALTNLLIFAVISLSEGEWQRRMLVRTVELSTVVTLIDTSVAVTAAALLQWDASLLWLLAPPVGVIGLSYRAYLGERRKHAYARFLYETTQDLQRAKDVDAATRALLEHVLRIFRAGRAEVLRGTKRTVLGGGRPGGNELRTKMLVEGGEIGTLVVGDRPRAFDQHERQLFETLAGHAGVSLEVIALGERLRHQALHDSMTGLANRAVFHDRLQHALARADRHGASVAVLVLDLDDFKTVNDSLGHNAGDQLLVTVAERLRTTLREADTCARLGGDEFGVLLEDCGSVEDVLRVAEAVADALRRPVTLEGREVAGRASVGAALALHGQGAEELLRNADLAMYRAKNEGKGVCRLFEGGMDAYALRRLELRHDLQVALDGGQLALEYQPVVALATGAVTGVEALLRWRHPARGTVSPGDFVPLAEETGLIVPIGRWVLDEALGRLAQWHAELPGPPTTMCVNISAVQLQRAQLVDDVRAALARSGVDPACLTLEITESIFMADVEDTIATLRALKALGVTIAIDDFGTGYSSLGYLARLPIDVLKIAKPFVDELKAGPQHDALAQAIVRIGESLGLTTLAEGIEEASQLEHLQELRCELGQGFLFARPLPADAVAEVLRGGSVLQAA